MSHSKKTKRGNSLYVESWNPSAKKHINTCRICGAQGYNPSIEEDGFIHPSPNATDYEHCAIYAELSKIMPPLALDELDRCAQCAKIMDKNSII